jgi:hypothetical protein
LAQRRLKVFGWLAAVGAVVAIVGLGSSRFIVGPSLVPIFVAIGGFLVSLKALKDLQPWLFGDLGEKRTLKALARLGDEYEAWTNFVIPSRGRQTSTHPLPNPPPGRQGEGIGESRFGDLDIVLFGPHGALVIECKEYDARYACDGEEWVNIKPNGYRKKMKSPSRQASGNARAFEKYLTAEGRPMRVSAVIVVPRGSKVAVTNPTVDVIPRDRLLEYVGWLGGQRAEG